MFKVLVIAALVATAIANPVRNLEGKIIGGKDIPIKEVPYQVSLFYGKRHNCGGSIISEKYILTAQHCIREGEEDSFHVRAGSANYKKDYTVHQVVKFIVRKPNEAPADIALVEVNPPFEFDETHVPIPLFSVKEEIEPNTVALVTGWGRTHDNISPVVLQGVQVPMISKEDCYGAYENYGGIKEGEICAAHPNGGKDSCQGDSGGPLAINGNLVGIVSWGIGCAQKEYPGVYVEVAHYAEWIKENADL